MMITSVEKQTKLWKTHIDTILNKEAPREVEGMPEKEDEKGEETSSQKPLQRCSRKYGKNNKYPSTGRPG